MFLSVDECSGMDTEECSEVISTLVKFEEKLTRILPFIPITWEPPLFNLAHTFRRMKKWSNGNIFFFHISFSTTFKTLHFKRKQIHSVIWKAYFV